DNPGRQGPGFDLYSLGADGAPGGEDDNADIYAE
ncbi:MAG: type II secretion system protein GspG, partial [Sphingomonadales bacterium]|nr:type II secretion system protein GspG [Sphingomonadales bacterium]